MLSLKAQQHALADPLNQLELLSRESQSGNEPHAFSTKLRNIGLFPLKPTPLEIFQVNIGKMCNQTCKHCHVDAGPDRKEIMTREIMQACLEAIVKSKAATVDITGGAPEMNPDFRWFVEEVSKLGKKIMVRCNLTIIVSNRRFNDLPDFFAKHQVEVVSSLPYFTEIKTDSQRGNGVFEKSIAALKLLNERGYGKEGSGLVLNLVHNPSGAFLPPDQAALEIEFKRKLKEMHGVEFNSLFTITNLPISRFLDYLINSGNYDGYMEKLINSFNPVAAQNVMCRNTISVGWDGYLYDCDFNQMLDLKVDTGKKHIVDFDLRSLAERNIVINQHCFGCTAGAGSSCGGATA